MDTDSVIAVVAVAIASFSLTATIVEPWWLERRRERQRGVVAIETIAVDLAVLIGKLSVDYGSGKDLNHAAFHPRVRPNFELPTYGRMILDAGTILPAEVRNELGALVAIASSTGATWDAVSDAVLNNRDLTERFLTHAITSLGSLRDEADAVANDIVALVDEIQDARGLWPREANEPSKTPEGES